VVSRKLFLKPDNPQDFDRRWRDGIAAELTAFRELMPHALMSGHAMDVTDPLIASIFNAISIGFVVPAMVEGHTSVEDGEAQYTDWMELPAHTPRITMIESAVRFQLGCECHRPIYFGLMHGYLEISRGIHTCTQ
jgi:hypothetical protein